jgi:hypothetical protein
MVKRLLIVRCCVIQCIAHVRSVTWLDSFAVWEDAEELVAEHDAPVEAGLLHQTKRFRRDRVRWLGLAPCFLSSVPPVEQLVTVATVVTACAGRCRGG